MVDYKTFKKEYLNEWVDRSLAARKAAEELAMKDGASLRDIYKPEGLIFDLGGKKIEFKAENEICPYDDNGLFTWYAAHLKFREPDKDGWRLPTESEMSALKNNAPYKFVQDKDMPYLLMDGRLRLPAEGFEDSKGGNALFFKGETGDYWTSTPLGGMYAIEFKFTEKYVKIDVSSVNTACSVRLVREVN